MSYKVLVSTHPFGASGEKPLEVLKEAGCDVLLNPYKRKMTPEELRELLSKGIEGLVAGTEPITKWVIEGAPRLRVISRVGVGLDNVDLKAAREAGIVVTYTPQAPALAVAELTIGLIIDLLRRVSDSNKAIRRNTWLKHLGLRMQQRTVGVAGVGRIGKRVINLLKPFGCRILAHDHSIDYTFADVFRVEWVDKQTLLEQSDIITIHLPLSPATFHWIDDAAISLMKPAAYIVNAARGPIVHEDALYRALKEGRLAGAAVDVFDKEPYSGPLCTLDNIILTCHMGAATVESRFDMELEAALDCVRALRVEPVLNPVPEDAMTMPEYPDINEKKESTK